MNHFDFPQKFHTLYDKALDAYAKGQRDPSALFTPAETAFLSHNGLTAQHLYDYAEDHHNYGEPGYDQALAIELVRRDYFLNVQDGHGLVSLLDETKLPAKTDAVKGVTWLPRLIPKTKAKLRGQLPASLMYCCGGDRAFFKQHNILPAEFLAVIWRHLNDDAAVINWVIRRSKAAH